MLTSYGAETGLIIAPDGVFTYTSHPVNGAASSVSASVYGQVVIWPDLNSGMELDGAGVEASMSFSTGIPLVSATFGSSKSSGHMGILTGVSAGYSSASVGVKVVNTISDVKPVDDIGFARGKINELKYKTMNELGNAKTAYASAQSEINSWSLQKASIDAQIKDYNAKYSNTKDYDVDVIYELTRQQNICDGFIERNKASMESSRAEMNRTRGLIKQLEFGLKLLVDKEKAQKAAE